MADTRLLSISLFVWVITYCYKPVCGGFNVSAFGVNQEHLFAIWPLCETSYGLEGFSDTGSSIMPDGPGNYLSRINDGPSPDNCSYSVQTESNPPDFIASYLTTGGTTLVNKSQEFTIMFFHKTPNNCSTKDSAIITAIGFFTVYCSSVNHSIQLHQHPSNYFAASIPVTSTDWTFYAFGISGDRVFRYKNGGNKTMGPNIKFTFAFTLETTGIYLGWHNNFSLNRDESIYGVGLFQTGIIPPQIPDVYRALLVRSNISRTTTTTAAVVTTTPESATNATDPSAATTLLVSTSEQSVLSTETSTETDLTTSQITMNYESERTISTMTTDVPILEVSTAGSLSKEDYEAFMNWKRVQHMIPLLGEPARIDLLDDTDSILEACPDFKSSKMAPPSWKNGQPLPITIALEVSNFPGIDTLLETVDLSGILLLSWQVKTCPKESAQSDTDRRLEQVQVVDPEKVWIPKLRFTSAASSNIYLEDLPRGEDFLVTVNSKESSLDENRTLSFYWLREGLFTADCELDLKRFPFDEQTCSFDFALQRSKTLIDFDLSRMRFFWLDETQIGLEWQVKGWNYSLSSERFNGHEVAKASFLVRTKRIPDYYLTNLVLPAAVLAGLCIPTLAMPPETPDRSVFTVTLVLALTVTQSEVMNQVPKKAHANLLSSLVQYLVWFSVIITLYELLTLWLAFSVFENNEKTPKTCNKKISLIRFIDVLALILSIGAFVGLIAHFMAQFN